MKTTIYNVLVNNEKEVIIEDNTVRFELNNGGSFVVENKGSYINITNIPKRGDGQIYVKPKVGNIIEITTDL